MFPGDSRTDIEMASSLPGKGIDGKSQEYVQLLTKLEVHIRYINAVNTPSILYAPKNLPVHFIRQSRTTYSSWIAMSNIELVSFRIVYHATCCSE